MPDRPQLDEDGKEAKEAKESKECELLQAVWLCLPTRYCVCIAAKALSEEMPDVASVEHACTGLFCCPLA